MCAWVGGAHASEKRRMMKPLSNPPTSHSPLGKMQFTAHGAVPLGGRGGHWATSLFFGGGGVLTLYKGLDSMPSRQGRVLSKLVP